MPRSRNHPVVTPHRIILAAKPDPAFIDLVGEDPRFVLEDHSEAPDLGEVLPGASVLVTRSHVQVGESQLTRAGELRLILQGTSGVDNLDVSAAKMRGISVVTVPGVNANAVAEAVIGVIIALTRSIRSYDSAMRAGSWDRADCAEKRELRAQSVGIIGLGRVGSRLALLLRSFGCRVFAFDPYIDSARFDELGVERWNDLDELLARSDVVSFHVPLTAETKGMVTRDRLELLPPGSVLINTSRGAVVDYGDLVESLDAGRLSAAWVDVFDAEPPDFSNLPSHPNLLMTPHIAGCTKEARDEIGETMYRALIEHFK